MSVPRSYLPGVWLLVSIVFMGCNSSEPPTYQDRHGLRFTPPAGWVLRAREDATPNLSSQKQQGVPMPPMDSSGKTKERLVARYDHLSSGHHAWFRVTLAEVPSSTPVQSCIASPGRGWKREGETENVEVGGLPAARLGFVGRWSNQDYRCETVAVRQDDKVYFFTASFPAADASAGQQVRQSLATATWQQ